MKPAGKSLEKIQNTPIPITAAGITVDEIKLFKNAQNA
jgi:energy-converting hydrogenase Eha subunit A